MYCGNNLITDGMTRLDMLSKCGAPNLKGTASVHTVGRAVRGAFRLTSFARLY